MIERAIRLGKVTEGKTTPLLISLAEATFNKVNIAHDLTMKQKQELKEKIEDAQEKEQNDQL